MGSSGHLCTLAFQGNVHQLNAADFALIRTALEIAAEPAGAREQLDVATATR